MPKLFDCVPFKKRIIWDNLFLKSQFLNSCPKEQIL